MGRPLCTKKTQLGHLVLHQLELETCIPFRVDEQKVSYHMESLPFNNMDSLDLTDIRNCSSQSDTQEYGKDGG